jgi:saccharolysin
MSSTSVNFKSLPQSLTWTDTPESLQKRADDIIALHKQVYDEVAKELNPKFENTILKIAEVENKFLAADYHLGFYHNVSTDAGVRDTSIKVEEQLDQYRIEAESRVDVYKVVKVAFDNLPSNIDPESKKLAVEMERDFRRAGLNLESEKLEKVVELRKKLSNISVEFSKNLAEEKGYLLFTKEELEGLNESVIEQFAKEGDKYKVTFKYPDIVPFLKEVSSGKVRKLAWNAYEDRCVINNDLMAQLVKLRSEKAAVMGYKSHADFVLEPTMAKNAETVGKFLNNLKDKMSSKAVQELKVLTEMKQEELASRGLPAEDKLFAWDTNYFLNKFVKKEYNVDENKISEYFPMDPTIKGMFSIFERLFSLKFVSAPEEEKSVWHSDVHQFAVFTTDKGQDQFLGWIYLDLHPRENKYTHAANFGLRSRYTDVDGTEITPVTALVCNFSKPTPTRPSLLRHSEVVTFFHELGHGIHDLVGQDKYARFSGHKVGRDFVEAPSQMLEFWTWNKAQLKELSGHYKSGEELSDELIDSLIRSKHANAGTFYSRQLFFGLFDFTLHTTNEPLDIAKVWNDLKVQITFMDQGGIISHGYSSFGHLAGGYDAGYYGYLWSEVFAADMYYTRFKADPLNKKAGIDYRDKVIGRGDTGDANDYLKDFLGREPNTDAFFKEIGAN